MEFETGVLRILAILDSRKEASMNLWILPLAALCMACGKPSDSTAELWSRAKYNDYEKATFSFEHGLRDDPGNAITRNDWDIEFGNGDDVFGVTMVTDDRSRLKDLGPLTWEEFDKMKVDIPEPYAEPTRETNLPVIVGHMYIVRTVDSDSDLTTAVHVESLIPGDRVTFTWRRIN